MNIEEEVQLLKKELRDTKDVITELRIASARQEATRSYSKFWLGGMAAALAAWLGVTSLWQIPKLVNATTAGQAKEQAENAAKDAIAASESISEAVANIREAASVTNYVSYDDVIAIASRGVELNGTPARINVTGSDAKVSGTFGDEGIRLQLQKIDTNQPKLPNRTRPNQK